MKAIEKPQAIIYSTLFILLAIIALILSVSGCTSERIEGNHDLVTVDRSCQPFSHVVSQGGFHVVVLSDSITRVVVKAETNILPYIYTISDGTTMTVGVTNGYNIHENYLVEVFLYTPVLENARISGSGLLDCSGFTSNDLSLEISGSGDINGDIITNNLNASISGSGNMNLTGNAKNSTLNISGSGNINAQGLIQEYCVASISGSGNITASVSKTLHAIISGSGSIYYLGNPVVTTQITGSGHVQKY
jgi:hypothetical protein